MKIEIDDLEFEAEGTADLLDGEYVGEIPEEVLERVSSELGDIEMKSFNMEMAEDTEGVILNWELHGRRDPLDL